MSRASWIAGSAAIVLLVSSVHAQRAWIEVRSPNFVVMSEGDERAARNVAWQFEQVRIALVAYGPGRVHTRIGRFMSSRCGTRTR